MRVEPRNHADITASAMTNGGCGTTIDHAMVTLDYVLSESGTTATVSFEGDLAVAQVTLRAKLRLNA